MHQHGSIPPVGGAPDHGPGSQHEELDAKLEELDRLVVAATEEIDRVKQFLRRMRAAV